MYELQREARESSNTEQKRKEYFCEREGHSEVV